MMGIRTHLDGYPAEALGGLTIGVSPLEMASAYGTIANGGYRVRPTAITKVEFPDGHVEKGKKLPPRFRVKRIKAFSDGVTYKATKILEKNVQAGTGTRAQIGCPAAGKTGTTDNFTDAWFVGFTPRLATSVWVGYPTAKIEMRTLYQGGPVAGGTFPAQIWGAYMKHGQGQYCGAFAKPNEPFVASPFFGHYARTGGKDTGDDDGQQAQPGRQRRRHAQPRRQGSDNGGGQGNDNGGGTSGTAVTATAARQRPATATRRRRRADPRLLERRPEATAPACTGLAALPGLVKLARRRGGAPMAMREGSAGSTTSRIAETSVRRSCSGNRCRQVVFATRRASGSSPPTTGARTRSCTSRGSRAMASAPCRRARRSSFELGESAEGSQATNVRTI